jgi:hypothetical protein
MVWLRAISAARVTLRSRADRPGRHQDTSFINDLVWLGESEISKIAGIEVVEISESPH